jgi:hypothetical protein
VRSAELCDVIGVHELCTEHDGKHSHIKRRMMYPLYNASVEDLLQQLLLGVGNYVTRF